MVARRYDCPQCPSVFSRSDTLQKHKRDMHTNAAPIYRCFFCENLFPSLGHLHQHTPTHAPQQQNGYNALEDLDGAGTTYSRNYLQHGPIASLELTLGLDHGLLYDILKYEAVKKRYAKCNITVIAEFVMVDLNGKVERMVTIFLKAKTFLLTLYQEYDHYIRRSHAQIAINLEDFVTNGSGWMLYAVHRTELKVAQCHPLSGGCGEDSSQISVGCRRDIRNFRQISIEDDKMCFYRSVARHYVGHDDRIALDEFIRNNLKIDNFELPFRVDKIAAFERLHADTLNFRINLIYKENNDFFPAFVSTRDAENPEVINILLYHQHVGSIVETNCHRRSHQSLRNTSVWEKLDPHGFPEHVDFSAIDEDEDDYIDCVWENDLSVEAHYAYISNVRGLLKHVYSKGGKKRKRREGVEDDDAGINPKRRKMTGYASTIFCPNCLNSFTSQKWLDEHFELCKKNDFQRIVTPKKGEYLEFTKHINRFPVALMGFFDFEAVQVPPENRCTEACVDQTTCHHKQPSKSTFVVSDQEASTYSLVIVNHENRIIHKHTHSSSDAAGHFVKHLLDIEPTLQLILNANEPMNLSPEEEADFQLATICHICQEPLVKRLDNDEDEDSDDDDDDDVFRARVVGGGQFFRDAVRDHCHLTGQYQGASHNDCNLARRVCKKVSLYCHNFSNYDSHFVLGAIRDDDQSRIYLLECLPKNQEKMRTLKLNCYEFIDSLSFLNGSLSAVVDDLHISGYDFGLLYDAGLCENEEQHRLLLRKGKLTIFPTHYFFIVNITQNGLLIISTLLHYYEKTQT